MTFLSFYHGTFSLFNTTQVVLSLKVRVSMTFLSIYHGAPFSFYHGTKCSIWAYHNSYQYGFTIDQQNFKKVPRALSWHATLLHITLLHLSTDKQTDKYAWYYSILTPNLALEQTSSYYPKLNFDFFSRSLRNTIKMKLTTQIFSFQPPPRLRYPRGEPKYMTSSTPLFGEFRIWKLAKIKILAWNGPYSNICQNENCISHIKYQSVSLYFLHSYLEWIERCPKYSDTLWHLKWLLQFWFWYIFKYGPF